MSTLKRPRYTTCIVQGHAVILRIRHMRSKANARRLGVLLSKKSGGANLLEMRAHFREINLLMSQP